MLVTLTKAKNELSSKLMQIDNSIRLVLEKQYTSMASNIIKPLVFLHQGI